MNPQPNTPVSINEAVARVVHRTIPAGHGTDARTTFDVEWLTIDPFQWSGDLYAAPGAAIDADEQQAEISPAAPREAIGYAEHWAAFEEKRGNTLDASRVRKVIASLASRQEAPAANGEALSDALNEFVPEWDDKAYEIRKLRAKIKRITDALATPSEAPSPATVAQPVGDEDDKRNARGASFRVEDLKLPLPALPEPFIASTEIGYSLHRAPEVLRFGADCYRLAQAAQPCASQGCGGAVRARPSVPLAVSVAISAYGDARADDDGTSATRLGECINEIRNAMTEAAALSTDKSGGA